MLSKFISQMVNIRRGARRGRPARGVLRGAEEPAENAVPAGSVNNVNMPNADGQRAENVEAANNAGVAAGGENLMETMLGMMAQILQRLPGPVPAGAQVVPPVGEVPRVAEVRAVIEEVPSYLKMMNQMENLRTKFFEGGAKPVEAEEWRCRLERNFSSIRCPEPYKIELAVHYLDGDAHTWWGSVAARRDVAEMAWSDFVEEFNSKYFPQEARDRLEAEFLDLAQGSRTIREYEMEFNRLKRYAGQGLQDEKTQVQRFLRGMRPELRTRCIVRSYASVNELVERAALIEEGLRDEVKASNLSSQPKKLISSGQNKGGKVDRGQKRKWENFSKSSDGGNCFRCGSKDHRIFNCPKPDNRSCYHCKEVGHIASRCPKLQHAGGKSGAPQAERALVSPRVYSMGVEEQGPSNRKSAPIQGKNLSRVI